MQNLGALQKGPWEPFKKDPGSPSKRTLGALQKGPWAPFKNDLIGRKILLVYFWEKTDLGDFAVSILDVPAKFWHM